MPSILHFCVGLLHTLHLSLITFMFAPGEVSKLYVMSGISFEATCRSTPVLRVQLQATVASVVDRVQPGNPFNAH